jgi:hypothetical protein
MEAPRNSSCRPTAITLALVRELPWGKVLPAVTDKLREIQGTGNEVGARLRKAIYKKPIVGSGISEPSPLLEAPYYDPTDDVCVCNGPADSHRHYEPTSDHELNLSAGLGPMT